MTDFGKILVSLTIILVGFFVFVSPSLAQGTAGSAVIEGNLIEVDTEFFDNWGVAVEITSDPGYVATGGLFTTGSGGGTYNFGDDFPGDNYVAFSSGSQAVGDFTPSDFGNWRLEIQGSYPIIIEFSYNEDFSIGPVVPDSNATWGSAGIWGNDFTVADVPTVLEASVQATGFQLWPLLIFSGIALAFIIFLQVVFLVNKSVKPKKSGFDEVAFNNKADELETYFKKTGGASQDAIESIRRNKK